MVIINPYKLPLKKLIFIFLSFKRINDIVIIKNNHDPITGCIQIKNAEKKPDNFIKLFNIKEKMSDATVRLIMPYV